MRIDKYLKVSRIIKRRSVAKEYLDNGLVSVNNKIVKACFEVKINDVIQLKKKDGVKTYKVVNIFEYATEEKAKTMYEEI
ncbi:MAG TPA: hypothetical protein DDW20_04030 [Firmicutes bacterium]|nr:hypothetical protein [Bacillota bacterium]